MFNIEYDYMGWENNRYRYNLWVCLDVVIGVFSVTFIIDT